MKCFKSPSPEEQQKEIYKQLMKHPMTTTTFTIEGHKIIKQLGTEVLCYGTAAVVEKAV